MNAPAVADLLADLRRRGVRLAPNGDRIHFEAPNPSAFPEELRDRVREHRDAVLRALRAEVGGAAQVPQDARTAAISGVRDTFPDSAIARPRSALDRRLAVAYPPDLSLVCIRCEHLFDRTRPLDEGEPTCPACRGESTIPAQAPLAPRDLLASWSARGLKIALGADGHSLETNPRLLRWSQSDFDTLVDRQNEIRATLGVANEPTEVRLGFAALRVYSQLIGGELWLAADDQAAAELRAEGSAIPVMTLDDVTKLQGMDPAEARMAIEGHCQ